MELKAMFPNLNVLWTRWSDYEITTFDHVEYLVPAEKATPLAYDCAEQAEQLVANALELGRQLRMGAPDKNRLCAAFAACHGLLGLARVNTYDPDGGPLSAALDSRQYGEPVDELNREFQKLYYHFLYTRADVPPPEAPAVMLDLEGTLHYRLTGGLVPQLIWEAHSMYEVLRLSYAVLMTQEKPTLKVCKNCGKVYYNTHAKSEFCGTKCRNYYNVKVFRGKGKDSVQ